MKYTLSIDGESHVNESTVAPDDVSSFSNGTHPYEPTLNGEWEFSIPNVSSDAIQEAVQNGDLPFIQDYIKMNCMFSIDSVVSDGQTVLHHACVNGQFHVVKYVVGELHADVNRPTMEGKTALHFACQHGNVEIVRYF
jgi:ankyrin repeat protein